MSVGNLLAGASAISIFTAGVLGVFREHYVHAKRERDLREKTLHSQHQAESYRDDSDYYRRERDKALSQLAHEVSERQAAESEINQIIYGTDPMTDAQAARVKAHVEGLRSSVYAEGACSCYPRGECCDYRCDFPPQTKHQEL